MQVLVRGDLRIAMRLELPCQRGLVIAAEILPIELADQAPAQPPPGLVAPEPNLDRVVDALVGPQREHQPRHAGRLQVRRYGAWQVSSRSHSV